MSETWQDWIGRERWCTDRIDAARANALLAALGAPAALGEGDALPPLFHWLYFWDVREPSQTGVDGHPARGDFLPPLPQPRRMWAGGEFSFHGDPRVGDVLTRHSRIEAIDAKRGRSGPLVFVTVVHALQRGEKVLIRERQDLVYREAEGRAPAIPAPDAADEAGWATRVDPDPVLLFRYSALTMNSHRIHYDAPYACEAEGYPALVVQGPLQATLLARQACAGGRRLARFAFRGMAPAFCGAPIGLVAEEKNEGMLLATRQGGRACMTAEAGFRTG